MTVQREQANQEAFKRLTSSDPVLVDVRRADEVIPGMAPNVVLTSGAPIPWSEVTGLQRAAVLHGAMYEGLAGSPEEAQAKLDRGEIRIEPNQSHGCAGAGAGICTASMPVYVVENRTGGNRSYCTFFEGMAPRILVNGAWGDDVIERLRFIERVLAPVTAAAVRRAGGIPLNAIIRRALHMGDDLHARNNAATMLFASALYPHLLDVAKEREEDVRRTIRFLDETPVAFLRLALSASKAAVDAAHGVEGSSMVTGMAVSSREFGIRVSGLGDEWFRGPHPVFKGAYFPGGSGDSLGWPGAESVVNEANGLGGFAQAAAFPLQSFLGSVPAMIERNLRMYDITIGEHTEFQIPYFGYRGVPAGIDIFKVVETGITPVIDGAVCRADGEGLAGVGPLETPIECFQAAVNAYRKRYAV